MSTENQVLQYFSEYIQKEIGIVYREDSYFQLKNRLESLRSQFGFKDLNHLLNLAQRGMTMELKTHLLDLATNNETSFFRDKKVFDAIERAVIPEILQHQKNLNIWSVASSSGQEAYSMAMLLEEYKERSRALFDYSVYATDICSEILKKAKAGAYSQLEVQRGLDAHLLIKYFKQNKEKKSWEINNKIKSNVEFKQLNLITPFLLRRKFDLILCRNVLIYQTKEMKEQILKRVSRSLKPGGTLILGSGETLIGIKSDYHQNIKDGAVLYVKRDVEDSLTRMGA
jgi:chemotaxis protein methyltransferase CheR